MTTTPDTRAAEQEAEAVIEALRGDVSGEPCSDCGATPTVADVCGSSKRYCRIDAGPRMARGEDVIYDETPADGEAPRTETDCRGSGIYDCPCEADGPDGLCSCCRSGECNGSCVAFPCDASPAAPLDGWDW